MFDIPGYKAAGPAEAPEVKDNNSPKTSYLTVDPNSENNVRRIWPVGAPQAMATASPTARAVGAMAADAGKWTPNPSTVAEDDVLHYSTPTASRDAQGKTLPQYRMGIGHRILGTLANFASGFARNGARPIYVGPGALNNRYYQDEQERQQNLAGAKQRLQTLQNEQVKDPPLETTNPEDTPPELNKNIPPVGPAAREQTSGGQVRNSRDEIDWRTVSQNPITGRWVGRTYGGQRKEVPGPPWMVGNQPSAIGSQQLAKPKATGIAAGSYTTGLNAEDEEDREEGQ